MTKNINRMIEDLVEEVWRDGFINRNVDPKSVLELKKAINDRGK